MNDPLLLEIHIQRLEGGCAFETHKVRIPHHRVSRDTVRNAMQDLSDRVEMALFGKRELNSSDDKER